MDQLFQRSEKSASMMELSGFPRSQSSHGPHYHHGSGHNPTFSRHPSMMSAMRRTTPDRIGGANASWASNNNYGGTMTRNPNNNNNTNNNSSVNNITPPLDGDEEPYSSLLRSPLPNQAPSPHMVSTQSLPTFHHGYHSTSSTRAMKNQAQRAERRSTPYASLKDLVKAKSTQQQQRASQGGSGMMMNPALRNASLSSVSSFQYHQQGGSSMASPMVIPHETTEIASVFAKPSNFLRQALFSKDKQQDDPNTSGGSHNNANSSSPQGSFNWSSPPESDLYSVDTRLHEACRTPEQSKTFILQFLLQNPTAASIAYKLCTSKDVYDITVNKVVSKPVNEEYSYPINLAIAYKADADILEALVQAAPRLLTTTEGHQKRTPVHNLLHHMPQEGGVLDLMLLKNPDCVSIKDAKFNTPLHVACLSGAPLESIQHLVALHPEALFDRNFHGLTPLHIVQRGGRMQAPGAADQVSQYLGEAINEHF